MKTGGIFGDGALGIVGGGVFGQKSASGLGVIGGGVFGQKSASGLGLVGGGVFGQKSASGCGALGISPPFPDVYGCNTNDQCQSGWCNTAINVPGAAGQCQTRGKVNPSIGGDGKAGAYCSSDDNCSFGLLCNKNTKMCESAADPGNACYRATQMGFQDGLARLPKNAAAAASKAATDGNVVGVVDLAKLAACYADGYAKGVTESLNDTRPCSHVGVVQKVQRAIGTPPTGTWTAQDQAALGKTGKSFKSFAPSCTGSVPGVPAGTQPVKTAPPPVVGAPPAPLAPTKAGLFGSPLFLAGLAAAGIGAAILLTGGKDKKSAKSGAGPTSRSSRIPRSYRSTTRR